MSGHPTRSSGEPNWPLLVLGALAVAMLAVSANVAVLFAFGAAVWFVAGIFTQTRRAKNLSLLRSYWWILLFWAAIVTYIAIHEMTKSY